MIHRLHDSFHSVQTEALPPTWTYNYTASDGSSIAALFIGTDPRKGAVSTTVPVYIIPLKLVSGSTSEDPTVVTQNGVSVIKNITNSPIFSKTVDFTSGGVNFGTTQYEDAFQKGTVYGLGGSNSGYHVLLGTPTIEPVQTLTLSRSTGSVQDPYGQTIIAANINTVDSKVNALISSLGIPTNAFPLFIITNSYMYQGSYSNGCCIGGYHSATSSGQPYGVSTYITQTGNFAEDVSALSHELGEYIDDPEADTPAPATCGSGAVLEVGDPLEGNANFGTYPYTVGGVTYHLQDLTYLTYFGAPSGTSVGNLDTFQNENLPFCSNGG